MATWADIQRGIFAGESGGDYGALFNYENRPDGRFSNVDLTQMTVDQALQFADPSGPYAQYVKGQVGRVATPMGAYQVVGSTLRSAKEGLGLTGNERMTPELQDRIGQWVYQAQGTGAWEGYKGPRVSTKGVSAMDGNNMNDQAMGALNAMQEQNKSDKYKDIAGNLAVAFNSMRLNPDPNIASTIKGIRDARSEKQAKSKTLAYLEKIGRGDLVSAIEAGLSPKAAISQMFTEAAELRGFERQKELAAYTAGLAKPKVSDAESKINRLMETGVPRETAIAISDGRLKAITDPQTGRTFLLDMATGQQISQVSQKVAQVAAESDQSGMFEGLDITKGTGARGWANKYINLVSDAITGSQAAPEASKVSTAMNILGLETLALADTQFAGKPTNFLRERVQETMVINPSELSTGPSLARDKAEAAISLLERSLQGATSALQSETSTLEQRRSAEAAIPQIQSLLINYKSLKNALDSSLNPPSSISVDPAAIDLMNSLLQSTQ
jgi:hypothetical protein